MARTSTEGTRDGWELNGASCGRAAAGSSAELRVGEVWDGPVPPQAAESCTDVVAGPERKAGPPRGGGTGTTVGRGGGDGTHAGG